MSFSASSAMNNDPTFSSVELVGGFSTSTLNWNNSSDLKVSGGFLVRNNILATGNIGVSRDVTVNTQTVVFGTLNGASGDNLVLVGDLTPMDSNVSGEICWNDVTVFGNSNVSGNTTFYDDEAQFVLMGNCLINGSEQTSLCANEDDTITLRVNNQAGATLQPNGAFKLGRVFSATGTWSFAEGNQTIASGFASHVEGNVSVAGGDSSHVLGYNNAENGFANHVEGHLNIVSGSVCHVEGHSNTVRGNVNTVLSVGGSTIDGNLNHVEGNGLVLIRSDTNHVETACKVNSELGLDHLESHDTVDLQSLNVSGSGINHSDSGDGELYLAGYCTSSSAGTRNLTKGRYGSVIGSDACCNQTGMTVISPGTVNASPFGSTFTTSANASVGHGHAQLSMFHLRTVTTGLASGNLSLEYPNAEVFPELIYRGGDVTVTNSDVLRQLWNCNLTVVGRDQSGLGSYGQRVNFIAVHNGSGNSIEIGNISKSSALSSGTLVTSNVQVYALGNKIRIEMSSSSPNETHWAGTLRTVNSGVMDFTGNLISKLI